MSLQSHIAELSRRHQAIEKEIQVIRTQSGADALHLVELKRRKLHLKDEIERLRH